MRFPFGKKPAPEPRTPPERVLLGHVIAPSGKLVLLDFGCLNLWSHRASPLLSEGIFSPEITDLANRARDLRIEGPDAREAGRLLDRGWHPLYVYDVGPNFLDSVDETFRQSIGEEGLDASLTVLPERISHRDRIDLALEEGRNAGEITFHGMHATVLGDLPRDRELAVYGEPMAEEEWSDRWRWVTLEVRPESEIATSRPVGHIAVDYARIMLADADALGSWVHEDTLDGQADFVFWGKDAESVARKFKADSLGEGTYGWGDVPIDRAVELGAQVEDLIADSPALKLKTDFRPHSHHYLVMRQVRATSTGTGTLQLGEAVLCGFMTSWGDGIFDVIGEFDRNDELVRVRIDLGNPEMVALVASL